MLLSDTVEISIRPNNKKYLNNKGYDITGKKIHIRVEDLSPNSRCLVLVKCQICDQEKKIKYLNYIKSIKKGGYYSCSGKCSNSKRKSTNIDNFGHEWASSSEVIKKKVKKTNLEIWGSTCPLHSKDLVPKIRKSNMDKYGSEFPSQNTLIKLKTKKTNLEKWGHSSPLLNDQVKIKSMNSMVEKWGVDNPAKNKYLLNKRVESFNLSEKKEGIYNNLKELFKGDDFKNSVSIKRKRSTLKNWGVDHYSKTDEFKEKIRDTLIDRYGTTGFNGLDEFKSKSKITRNNNLISKYSKILGEKYEIISLNDGLFTIREGVDDFLININNLRDRIYSNTEISTIKNPLFSGSKSGYEIQISDFVKSLGCNNIILGSKSIISPLELDIYIPELKLAIEFNGLYWHSEIFKGMNYHLNKYNECKKLGINLINIFEDDWLYKQEIIKSIISNKINKIENKIWARKCQIREIDDNKIIRSFLDRNHIQGFSPSNTKVGLFYKDELVSLMTFGYKYTTGKKVLELSRFCSKINLNVVGGANRLFQYYVNKYRPDKIISYSDMSIFDGGIYRKLGFVMKQQSKPNYYWVVDGKRHHRFKFNKSKLISDGYDPNLTEVEIMYSRKYYRIFGCGQISWKYELSDISE